MTLTPIPIARDGDGTLRADLLAKLTTNISFLASLEDAAHPELTAGLTDLAVFYATTPDAPAPARVTVNIPLGGRTRLEKTTALHRVAKALGTEVVTRDGVLYAERSFGTIVLEAHVSPEGETHGDILTRLHTARRRTLAAVSGDAA